ncbi:type I polyketide synthase [Kutzneria viridogrisea]|uniref:Phthiocerol/phenolphthiocerol synthesis type-I polyketide synthase D n=1 Tax=Kutzneria viridogrisea TaxID=47990 RepID=A0ABR6BMH4_9PSEU|nr:phthiocerol/phenolphthiocerol synthesis type-I polyketide synthase D [Kutzneria viridogrisea]
MNQQELRRWLLDYLAASTGIPADRLSVDRPIQDYGVSSRDAVALAGDLGAVLGRTLPATLVWQNPTIASLAAELLGEPATAVPVTAGAAGEPVAVIGLGCRLPGGIESPWALWQLLLDGGETIGEVPADRWPDAEVPRRGGFLADVAGFDAGFFGITPREAALMDPQQRILLEVAHAALEHAGIRPSSLRGSGTGVFVGTSASEYGALSMADPSTVDAWSATGAAPSVIANRLSYVLDLRGPSSVVDTACSSSLVAVHQAVRSLQHGESDLAFAAGVNLMLTPGVTATFDRAGLLAADGRCKAFDASADGIVRGEGCGVVLLKRLADAQRDGDRVLAVVLGSATNSDGRSNGLMAPNPAAQEALLRKVYDSCSVEASTVDYVEAHGTGTLLGDPMEAGALGAVLGPGRDRSRPLLIGSVKTNLGHLEGAAGVLGLIKVVLGLHNGLIPATRNYTAPNPHIDFDRLALSVVTEPVEWPRYGGLARAGVSAFGFGGTNAHVVLAEWQRPASPVLSTQDCPEVLAVSAHTEDAARQRAVDLADFLAESSAPLGHVAAALASRRDHHEHRLTVVGDDRAELARQLRDAHPVAASETAGVVFLYSGYGSHWAEMGRGLLATEPAFADAVDDLDPVFAWEAGFSLRELLRGQVRTQDIAQCQPALFGVQLALTQLWRAHGVEPSAVIGQSMGEVTAAVVAGALDLVDGLRVMTSRAELLSRVESAGSGTMAVVELSEQELAERYPDIEVAVYASPTQCTVTGDVDRITALVAELSAEGRLARKLNFTVAGHSSAVDGILGELSERLTGLRTASPRIPFHSTVSHDPRFDADYWVDNLRRPVRLVQAVRAALAEGHTRFVEVSPHPVTTLAVEQTAPVLALPTLRRDADEQTTFLTSLAALHRSGHPEALRGRYPSAPVVDLPGPRWQHERHWLPARTTPTGQHPLLGAHVELPEGDRHVWQADIGTDSLAWLADHQVHGTPVLPGTAYLEMALCAGRTVFGGPVVVSDLELHQVLVLAPSTEVTVSVRTTGEVTVLARHDGRWVHHATATVSPLADSAVVSLEPVSTPLEVDLYEALSAVGMVYGPVFRGLTAVCAQDGRASAVVQAVPAYQGCGLHPALADACLHALAAAALGELAGEVRAYLPMSLGAVRVLGDPQRVARCNARVARTDSAGEGLLGDVQLVADDGTVLVDIAAVYVRRLPRSEVPVPLTDKSFELRWQPSEPLPEPDPRPRTWLLFSEGELEQAVEAAWLTSRLGERGDSLIWACADGEHELGAVLEHLDERADLLVVVGPAEDELAADRARALLLTLSGLVRTLCSVSGHPPRLWLITRHGAALTEDELLVPGTACLRAMIRVLAFEHPELRATVVDLDAETATGDLYAELHADRDEDEVAWRAGRRYVARLARTAVTPGTAPVVRPGAYLITGGLGGLGQRVAGWLAERGALRVVLCGRTDRDVDSLRTKGIEVTVVLGDLAAPGIAERAVAAATEGGLPLHGVVHGAMVLDDHAVTTMGPADLERVWRPKVAGGLRLHAATEHLDLDWWLVFSSAAGVFGSPGQAAYATANAWLDAFTHWRRARGLPATTVNWGPWGADRDNPVLEPLGHAEGLEALGVVLSSGRHATTVTRLDVTSTLELFPELADRPFLAALTKGERRGSAEWSPPSPNAPNARALVLDRLCVQIAALTGLSVDRVDPSAPLTRLGMDSLMAMRARAAVERDFGEALPITLLLRGASVNEITDHLIGRPPTTVIGPRDPAERWVAQLWRQLLGEREFTVHEDFLAAGGDPGLLCELIAERTGQAPDPAGLLARPTIAGMADFLRDTVDSGANGPVTTLRATGGRPPLFLFHPAGGPTSVYRPLVALLGEQQPCYGFERLDEHDTVPERAAQYVRLLREIQPSGPYRLAGWSFGGCLAYETACQLTDAGERVELVALIDSILPLPTEEPAHQLVLRRYARFAEHVRRTYGVDFSLPPELAELAEDEQISLVMARLGEVPGMSPAVLRHQYTSYVDARLAERFRPRPYGGRVLLLRAEEPHPVTVELDPRYLRTDEALGWDALCADLSVVRVPGDHVSMIDPPHVDVLGARLAGALAAESRMPL